jgi:hypothetical protein
MSTRKYAAEAIGRVHVGHLALTGKLIQREHGARPVRVKRGRGARAAALVERLPAPPTPGTNSTPARWICGWATLQPYSGDFNFGPGSDRRGHFLGR